MLLATSVMAAEQLRQPDFIDVKEESATIEIIKDDVVRIDGTTISFAIKDITNESVFYELFPGQVSHEIGVNALQQLELEGRTVNVNLLDVSPFKVATLFISHAPTTEATTEPQIDIPVEITVEPPAPAKVSWSMPASKQGWLVLLGVFVGGIILIYLIHLIIGVRLFP
tara:strand:- start:819 stop:1325 length:507 start_codon:yes stop_codon:yes gene_type:complete